LNSGTMTVVDTTVDMTGGASYAGITNQGTLGISRSTMIRSTVSSQGTLTFDSSTSANSDIGGLFVYGGVATVTSSTIAGAGHYAISVTAGTVTVRNSILDRPTTGTTCVGAIISDGYNLAADASCSFTAATDLSAVAPKVGTLGAYGGPTLTYRPLAGSPAIDSGDPTCAAVDQRGVSRPANGQCDRGSVEQ